jgi:tetratricopeptide (TPR) repeat protein
MSWHFRDRFFWPGATLLVLGLALAATLAANTIQARRLRAELDQVRQTIAERRLGPARKSLVSLTQRWPGHGEILFLLGECEERLGRPERALAAWEQVPVGDPYAIPAAESRGSLLINLGRCAPAESCLMQALARAQVADSYPLLRAIARLFRLEGRYVEVSEVLTAAWSGAPDPGALLQDLWQNDAEPVPVDGWKIFLDKADSDDDRVWLGRARHALVTGRLDDAQAWLKRCLDRRPDDPVVWKAIVDLAVATADVDRFWAAAARLPAAALRPWEISVLRSWLVAQGTDRGAERRELARLIELRPLQTQAMGRLAELATESGDSALADSLKRRKGEVDRAKDWIRKLVVRGIAFRDHATELAGLSIVLGRPFDQHAWLLVAGSAAQVPAPNPGLPPPASDSQAPDLARSRAICQAAAERALAQVLASGRAGEPSQSHSGTMMETLADLRGAVSSTVSRGAVAFGAQETAPSPQLQFRDDAKAAGLRFIFDNGKSPMWLLPESLSGGVGLIDFDGDGWLDVYCVQGGAVTKGGTAFQAVGDDPEQDARATGGGPSGTAFQAVSGDHRQDARATSGDRLFRNQRDGTFRDVTAQSGIERLTRSRGYGMGIAVADYDNDGHPDLFITRLRGYDLFRNRGDGSFEDVTERAGLAGVRENPTSAAWADLDGDGDLDLYVCHYIRWDPEHPTLCKNEKGEHYYCDPAKYERAVDHVFRNDRGRFVDVTELAGFTDPDGRGLGVVAADLDDDGRIDLYVANDGTANFLFINRGGFRFEDTALSAGVAGSAQGGYQAGMGVASADLDGDGRLDLLVTNLYLEGTTLYHNLGQGLFADHSAASGILGATRYLLGFGIAIFDAANRGWPHVVITNGNVNDFRPFYPFAMPTRLYEARAGGKLVDISDRAGAPWAVDRLGRALAAGDLDNDGRVDFVVVCQNEPLAFFHNCTDRPGHFVTFRLEGTASNRDAVGARVVVTAGGRPQVCQRLGGGSYLAASDDRLHFGLGESTSIDSVEVRWPSGRVDRWTGLGADTGYLLREGDPSTRPLTGFPTRKGEKFN